MPVQSNSTTPAVPTPDFPTPRERYGPYERVVRIIDYTPSKPVVIPRPSPMPKMPAPPSNLVAICKALDEGRTPPKARPPGSKRVIRRKVNHLLQMLRREGEQSIER